MRRFLVFVAAVPLFGADFTVAVIPDPQNIADGGQYHAMCKWIADQKEALNVVAALGVGDLRNTPTEKYETAHATDCFATIDAAGIPWLSVPGNHDYTNYKSIRRSEISNWDAAFGPSAIFNGKTISAKSWYGGNYTAEATSHANWWIKWNAGTQKFLALGLEVCPRPAVLTWASGVLAANSDRQAILVTHSYQNSDGTLTARGDNYGCDTGAGGMDVWYDNHNDFGGYDGPELWSNFITNEPAIKTVLSGHILYSPYVSYRTTTNAASKPVLQIKTNFQIADQNLETDRHVVTLLRYRADANCGTAPNDHAAPCIEVSHYSTAASQYVAAYPSRGYAYEFQTPAGSSPPSIDSIVNGASFGTSISPKSWISVFGRNLVPVPAPGRPWRVDDIVNGVLPTRLEGVVVRINGKLAPICFVGPNQLNVQVPDDDSVGFVTVEVAGPNGATTSFVALSPVAPALFAGPVTNGIRYAAAVHPDGTPVGNPARTPGATPARPGEMIALYGTGFGRTDPDRPAGRVIEPAPLPGKWLVRIGDVSVTPEYAGVVAPGLYQFNVRVPELPDGDHSTVIELDGFRTQDNVRISVSR